MRYLLSIICLATLLISGGGCSRKTAANEEKKLPPKGVRISRAAELEVEQTVYATGSLAAFDRAVLSAKVPGRVQLIAVDLGSTVKKGDLLAQIEKRDFELKLTEAEAALAQARARLGLDLSGSQDASDLEQSSLVKEARAVLAEASKNRDRILKLRDQGILPEADIETAESTYQVAVNRFEQARQEAKTRLATLRERQAAVAIAEQQVKDAEIHAPFDGVIEQRQTSPGEFLSGGSPVIALVRIDPIRLRLEISERDAHRVQAGNRVRLRLEGMTNAYESQITRLSPVITAGNRMLMAEADFQNPAGTLRPGSFAKADIVVTEKARGIFVDKEAVVTFAGLHKVFVVENGKAVEQSVMLGRAKGNRIEVYGKIAPGAAVVLAPGSIRNGQPVEMIAQQT